MASRPPIPIPPARWPARDEAAASRLFSPIQIGAITARTRSWVPAMVPWRATDDGYVTPEVLAWYARFARGRPGVLVVEATGVRDIQSGPLLRIGDDRFMPGLSQLVETVRTQSRGETRLLIQIIDFLGMRRRPDRARFLGEFLAIEERHREALEQVTGSAPDRSAGADGVRQALLGLPDADLFEVLSPREVEDLEYGHRERVTDMHLPHVAALPETLPPVFADAARRAREAGFDGVELHYAHAYTMSSFLSPTNDRPDGYGASRQNRVRLPLEVYAAVRRMVGDDYTVGCRFLSDEVIAGGGRVEDAMHYGQAFAAAGMDFLSISKGGKFDDARQPKVGQAVYPYTGPSGHECMPTVRIGGAGPFGRNLAAVGAIRTAVRAAGYVTPVIAAGGINSFELAEDALKRGECDLVAAARQTLADPDWFLKMELGLGDQIRRCVYTNYCEGLDQKHVPVTCQLWDRDFTEPDDTDSPDAPIQRTHDGKRRLLAPDWRSDAGGKP